MDSRISARALSAALGGWRTREPAYEALADGIRLLCLDNRLAPRTALPAERELSAALHVSRSTVAAAYRSLRDSGHIASVRGSGSVTLPLRRRDPGRASSSEGAIDLQQASPPAWPGLAGLMSDVALSASSIVARTGYDVFGRVELREAIAERYAQRGIPTSPNEIVVTTGAQSAIHLLAAVLLGRGRSGADRDADVSPRRRRLPSRRCAARRSAGHHRPRMGSGSGRAGVRPHSARSGVPHAGLPEPDRPFDGADRTVHFAPRCRTCGNRPRPR